jgi:hypothetical protein
LFTSEEDEIIKSFVEKFGLANWKRIENYIHTRNARQCRERWTTVLSFENLNSYWSQEDDLKLESLVNEKGKIWTLFAQYFPSKNALLLKNRYALLMRRKNKETEKTNKKEKNCIFNGLISNYDFSFLDKNEDISLIDIF